jgi:xylulokinase
MSAALLGIDLGTSSVKTVVVDVQSGAVISTASAGYPVHHPEPGAAEQDPEAWWQATIAAVKSAMSHAGSEISIDAIGLSGQMHGTVLLAASGKPVGRAIIWSDTRSASSVRELTDSISRERLLAIAGSPLAAGFQAATIHWLRSHHPDLWNRTERVLLPKDYLRYRLTGGFFTDPSDAASTLLLDARTRAWSPELLQAAGVELNQLPVVAPSTAITGELTADAANALGLHAGIAVVGGAGDAAAAAVGAGVVDVSSLLLTLSTGTQALAPIVTPEVDLQGRIHTFCSAFEPGGDADGWNLMGATMSAGLALRWLREDLFLMSPDAGFDDINAAADIPIGANGLLFLPYLTGERTPYMNANARGLFTGLGPEHQRAQLTRAVMEGVAMALFDAYCVVREMGAKPDRIVLAGGGSRSRLWRQIIADLFGLPLYPLAIGEQSAYGAAILAAPASDISVAERARAWARYDAPVEPDQRAHDRYQELQSLFRELYAANVSMFEQLAGWRANETGAAS